MNIPRTCQDPSNTWLWRLLASRNSSGVHTSHGLTKVKAMSTTGLFRNAKLHIKQCFPPQRYSSSRPWRNLRCSKASTFFLIIDATTVLSDSLLVCLFFVLVGLNVPAPVALFSASMWCHMKSIQSVTVTCTRTGASERWIQNRFEGIFWWDVWWV